MQFDIIVVAGQSNAQGMGKSHDKKPIIVDDVYEALDFNPVVFVNDDNGKYLRLDVKMPPEVTIQNLQEGLGDNGYYYCDMSISFVESYLKNRPIAKGRNLIVIKSAIGGTGFALNQQGVGNVVYERSVKMTNYVLSLNKNNRIVAFLWHQGEHDAFEKPEMDNESRYIFYYNKLKEQLLDFRNKFSRFKFPIIAGSMCDEWKNTLLEKCLIIEKATKDVLTEIGYSGYVDLSGLKSNNQEFNDGDTIHFSKNSQQIIGKRYFDKFKEIVDE